MHYQHLHIFYEDLKYNRIKANLIYDFNNIFPAIDTKNIVLLN